MPAEPRIGFNKMQVGLDQINRPKKRNSFLICGVALTQRPPKWRIKSAKLRSGTTPDWSDVADVQNLPHHKST